MKPADALANTLQVNPAVARFVYAGLGVLAAAAIAISWGSNIDDLKIGAGYVLAFAFIVTILAAIARNSRMTRVICWIVVAAFAVWVLGLIGSVINLPASLPPTACYLRLHKELPEVCEARLRNESNDILIGGSFGDQGQARLITAPFVQTDTDMPLWTIQDRPAATTHTGRIFIQFTDALSRAEAVNLAAALSGLNWNVQGADAGGELVRSGPDTNEIRYFKPADREAAIELATTIHDLYPTRPVYVRDYTRLGSYVRPGQLEIWITQPLGDAI